MTIIINMLSADINISEIVLIKNANPPKLYFRDIQDGIIQSDGHDYSIVKRIFVKGENIPEKVKDVYYVVDESICKQYNNRNDFIIAYNPDYTDDVCCCSAFRINPYYVEDENE